MIENGSKLPKMVKKDLTKNNLKVDSKSHAPKNGEQIVVFLRTKQVQQQKGKKKIVFVCRFVSC